MQFWLAEGSNENNIFHFPVDPLKNRTREKDKSIYYPRNGDRSKLINTRVPLRPVTFRVWKKTAVSFMIQPEFSHLI